MSSESNSQDTVKAIGCLSIILLAVGIVIATLLLSDPRSAEPRLQVEAGVGNVFDITNETPSLSYTDAERIAVRAPDWRDVRVFTVTNPGEDTIEFDISYKLEPIGEHIVANDHIYGYVERSVDYGNIAYTTLPVMDPYSGEGHILRYDRPDFLIEPNESKTFRAVSELRQYDGLEEFIELEAELTIAILEN